ncbi:MAG: bifunctional oligoribonuclease/PAP phosphatase NrnA [Candidatus Hydrothermarchaeales archaeon]
MQDFIKYIKNFEGKALILSHQNADADAVSASIALFRGINKLTDKIQLDLGASNSVSRVGNQILKKFGENIIIDPGLDVDLIIIIDTSNLNQLAPLDIPLTRSTARKVVIDHHAMHEDTQNIAYFYIVDESASSCSELIYTFFKESGIEVDIEIGELILLGIIADTAHLKFASHKTLQIVNEILALEGFNYNKVLNILQMPEDTSRRIAHLKAAQRMDIHRIQGWVIVTSHVSSYNSSAAHSLLSLGADIAFVASVDKEGVQVSSRATPYFLNKTGIHLGRDIMPKIGEVINGGGGGHAGAAGAKGEGSDVNEILKECVGVVKEQLS